LIAVVRSASRISTSGVMNNSRGLLRKDLAQEVGDSESVSTICTVQQEDWTVEDELWCRRSSHRARRSEGEVETVLDKQSE